MQPHSIAFNLTNKICTLINKKYLNTSWKQNQNDDHEGENKYYVIHMDRWQVGITCKQVQKCNYGSCNRFNIKGNKIICKNKVVLFDDLCLYI